MNASDEIYTVFGQDDERKDVLVVYYEVDHAIEMANTLNNNEFKNTHIEEENSPIEELRHSPHRYDIFYYESHIIIEK